MLVSSLEASLNKFEQQHHKTITHVRNEWKKALEF